MKHYTDTAAYAYTREHEAATEKAEALLQWLKGHANAESVNWGHVGSMNHVSEMLDELLETVGA